MPFHSNRDRIGISWTNSSPFHTLRHIKLFKTVRNPHHLLSALTKSLLTTLCCVSLEHHDLIDCPQRRPHEWKLPSWNLEGICKWLNNDCLHSQIWLNKWIEITPIWIVQRIASANCRNWFLMISYERMRAFPKCWEPHRNQTTTDKIRSAAHREELNVRMYDKMWKK